jgi:hypothetical protein
MESTRRSGLGCPRCRVARQTLQTLTWRALPVEPC